MRNVQVTTVITRSPEGIYGTVHAHERGVTWSTFYFQKSYICGTCGQAYDYWPIIHLRDSSWYDVSINATSQKWCNIASNQWTGLLIKYQIPIWCMLWDAWVTDWVASHKLLSSIFLTTYRWTRSHSAWNSCSELARRILPKCQTHRQLKSAPNSTF